MNLNTKCVVGRMFEARLTQGNALKLIIDAMKDLVQDANFECSDSEISVQVVFEEMDKWIGNGFVSCVSDNIGITKGWFQSLPL